jgi:hypothetical protein
MNTTAGLPASEGQLTWNDQDGTLNIGLKGGNVTLQVGQEQVARVVNKTGANLFESEYRAVRIRSTAEGGTQGQRLAVVLAQANNDPNSVDTLGLVTEDIAVNQEGYVTTSGLVRNINTTGTLQSETWSDGDVLYLSPFTAGRLTNIKPQAPNHTVIMGFVVYKHQNQGTIYVKVDNGYEIDELHNVKINNLSGGDVLTYDSTQSVWKNTNTLKINSLSAERIFTTHLDALSANITVIDIKQYELSGFNVAGDVTINGSVSAQNISAGNIFSNGNRVATVVDPVRTTLTGNGTLSTFPISGASGLVNPSALIVAIDGILQEPSVDYTVASGNITFTSPLPNGSKAVVISPTNTLQVSNMIPSDGSVTSAKLDNSINVAGNFTSNGTENRLPNQLATSRNDIITVNLLELISLQQRIRQIIVSNTFGQASHSGSGGISISNPGTIFLRTGTTSGSRGGTNSGGNTALIPPNSVAGDSFSQINFSRRQVLAVKLATSASAGCTGRVYWGGTFNSVYAGDPTNKSIGIKIDGNGVYVFAHNGTTYTESTNLMTVTANIIYEFSVVSDGNGNVSIYSGTTLLGSITGGPTGLLSPPAYATAGATINNNATTTDANLILMSVAILSGEIYQ